MRYTTRGRSPDPAARCFRTPPPTSSRKSPAKVDTKLADRGPLLLISGSDDHTVPLKVTKEVFGKYAKGQSDTELQVLDGRGHSLTIDGGWHDVADVTLKWLAGKGF